MKNRLLYIMAALAFFTSCKDTWLMYDTSQKDHITFTEASKINTASFALLSENDIRVKATVFLMGQPASRDRKFVLETVGAAEKDSIKIGKIKYPVISARPGIDYSIGDLVLPAGEVKADFDIVLHRQPEMLGDHYVRVGLKLVENNEFKPLATDSTKKDAIISPYYYIYVTDGEPACPFWWKNGNAPAGWHYDLGNYYPGKFRRMLSYMHATKETNPVFYEYCVTHCGYYLDAEPDKELNNNMNVFWRQAFSSAWAKYVFIPMYNYYKQYYEEHPDDPNYEKMGTEHVNIKASLGWGDPLYGKYGFFN